MLARQVLVANGGVLRWAPLVRRVGRHQLAEEVAAGVVVRHRRGTYSLASAERARVAATRVQGVLSHESAALAAGLGLLLEPEAVHVTIRPHAMRRWVPPDVRLHYGPLSEEEQRRGVTDIVRTVVECAATLPFREALAVVDGALRAHMCTRAELLGRLSSEPVRASARARRALESATPMTETVFESALRAILLDLRLTCFVPQLPVETPFGRYRVDLGDPVARIVVEAESFEFHGRRQQLTRDCVRTNALVVDGWLVLRFSWEQVMYEPEYVAAVLLAAHGRRTCRAA